MGADVSTQVLPIFSPLSDAQILESGRSAAAFVGKLLAAAGWKKSDISEWIPVVGRAASLKVGDGIYIPTSSFAVVLIGHRPPAGRLSGYVLTRKYPGTDISAQPAPAAQAERISLPSAFTDRNNRSTGQRAAWGRENYWMGIRIPLLRRTLRRT
jgi:hypothetical protein